MVQSQPGAFVLAIAKGKITIASLYRTLLRASHGTCMIVMIFIGASIFGYLFTLTHVTRDRPPGLHERALLIRVPVPSFQQSLSTIGNLSLLSRLDQW